MKHDETKKHDETNMHDETRDKAYWLDRAGRLSFPDHAVIAGEQTLAVGGASFTCFSAIDGRELTRLPQCDARDADRSVASARKVFESGIWSQMAPAARKRVLCRFADAIDDHTHELALIESLDMGKPIADSLSVDVPAASRCVRWSAEAIDKVYGEVAPTPAHQLGLITREPLGVVAAIVPWNFPMLMAAWKIGPALATGNCVILKPSEKSSLSALRLAQLALDAGVPPGVFDVLTGAGPEAGEPLARHADVDGLVFTGSTAVGKHLAALCASSNMKRSFMECGGKNPNIVFADAPCLDEAASAAAQAIFYNQGEVCTAGSRLLVERTIGEEFINKVIEHARAFAPGHPLDPATTMGAIVDRKQFDTIMRYIEHGRREGARLRYGGDSRPVADGGCYIEPTVFDGVTQPMTIAREEIFGPVLACTFFDSADEALAQANDTEYGLAAALWTSNLSRAHRVAAQLRAGSVWVNQYDGGDMTAPFGGYKQSGNGRDKSLHALEKYTEIKATWIKLQP